MQRCRFARVIKSSRGGEESSIAQWMPNTQCVSSAMEAPYDGTEVTVVMEEIEDTYTYTSPVPSKKKKKYKSPGDHGEKAKKPR